MTSTDLPGDDGGGTGADQSGGHDSPLRTWRTLRHRPRPVRRRWTAVVTVVAVIVIVAIVEAVLPTPSAAPVPGSGDAVAVPPGRAHSSSAFCAAGTGGGVTTGIYLTNSTAEAVAADVTSVAPAPASGAVPMVHRAVTVPPLGTVGVNPSSGLPSGDNATTVSFAGGGVVASQVVSGPTGWSAAPCASGTSSQWAFAGGSTVSGNVLTLSLLNPTATDTVVNVTFLTTAGVVTPQAYQGLTVPAGQLVEENIGDYVQNAPAIATMVTAQAGALVSTEFQRWASGSATGLSVRLGAPGSSTVWRFAQTTAAAGSTVNFTLANPGSVPVTATFTLGLTSGSVVPHTVVIPPQSLVVQAASGTPGLPQQTPYSTTINSTGPLVVGRAVEAAHGSSAPEWGSSMGTVTAAKHWFVPSPGTATSPGTPKATVDSLAIANPGTVSATVEVHRLQGSQPVIMLTVAPHHVAVLGAKDVGGLDTFIVSSSVPVNVEEDSGPSGAPGIVSSAGASLTG